MLNELKEYDIGCPYCGEAITVLIDRSVPEQRYVEDCEVCCRPMELAVTVEEGEYIDVEAFRDDE